MKNLDFEWLTDEFMLYCRSTQLREKTMSSYEQTLHLFGRWLADELKIYTVDEVDAYGRKCLKDGISEASAKMFADFIIETAKSGNKYLQSNGEWSYYCDMNCDMIKCDDYWMLLREILPSKYDGPEVQRLCKDLEAKHALIQLQEDQIYALKESISRRDTSLAALRKEYKQLQIEIDTCRSKKGKNHAMQAKETAPISQQIETITTQIQQAETEKNHLVQEKNALPLLAFSQRSALRAEIKSRETKIASLKADVLGYEQQKESVISKYTKLNETLQNTIDGAVTKQKEDDSEIRQLQSETSKQTLEKNLEQRKKELRKTQDALQNLERAIAAERITCYKNHFRKGYRVPIPYFNFLIRNPEPNKRHWSAPV